jgi:hypothetical protein
MLAGRVLLIRRVQALPPEGKPSSGLVRYNGAVGGRAQLIGRMRAGTEAGTVLAKPLWIYQGEEIKRRDPFTVRRSPKEYVDVVHASIRQHDPPGTSLGCR